MKANLTIQIGNLLDIAHHKKMLKSKTRLNIEVVAALFYCLWPQCYAPSFSELNQPEASMVLQPLHFCETELCDCVDNVETEISALARGYWGSFAQFNFVKWESVNALTFQEPEVCTMVERKLCSYASIGKKIAKQDKYRISLFCFYSTFAGFEIHKKTSRIKLTEIIKSTENVCTTAVAK